MRARSRPCERTETKRNTTRDSRMHMGILPRAGF